MKRLNWRKLRKHQTYTVKEFAILFHSSPATVHQWIKRDGLPVMDDEYPTLIHGGQAIEFIKIHRAKSCRKLEPEQFRCMGCRSSRKANDGKASIHPHTSSTRLMKATCCECRANICKIISLKILPDIASRLKHVTRHDEAL